MGPVARTRFTTNSRVAYRGGRKKYHECDDENNMTVANRKKVRRNAVVLTQDHIDQINEMMKEQKSTSPKNRRPRRNAICEKMIDIDLEALRIESQKTDSSSVELVIDSEGDTDSENEEEQEVPVTDSFFRRPSVSNSPQQRFLNRSRSLSGTRSQSPVNNGISGKELERSRSLSLLTGGSDRNVYTSPTRSRFPAHLSLHLIDTHHMIGSPLGSPICSPH